MGQINCQQCIPYLDEITSLEKKRQQPPNIPSQMHRINILSKNRNSHELFTKKYSTQITREDTQQQTNTIYKDKAIVVLCNNERNIKIQVQKGKKVLIGTSINCHFHISTQNHFKIIMQYLNGSIFVNDLAIGAGAFIKSSICCFQKLNQSQTTELIMIDNKLIQIFLKKSTKIPNQIQVIMKNINQRYNQQQFIFNTIDIILKQQNKRTLFLNQYTNIDFQIQQNSSKNIEIIFNTQNCFKYINKNTQLKLNSILLLGSQLFKVKNIIFSQNFNNQNDIKIQDFQ